MSLQSQTHIIISSSYRLCNLAHSEPSYQSIDLHTIWNDLKYSKKGVAVLRDLNFYAALHYNTTHRQLKLNQCSIILLALYALRSFCQRSHSWKCHVYPTWSKFLFTVIATKQFVAKPFLSKEADFFLETLELVGLLYRYIAFFICFKHLLQYSAWSKTNSL